MARTDEYLARIIPARAGFTGRRRACSRWPPDHPRSRGVYKVRLGFIIISGGSSPLARGLLRSTSIILLSTGIIPARAGFTHECCAPSSGNQDHPRSRGVYVQVTGAAFDPKGSSPLARGLPGSDRHAAGSDRIIPARAGFTPTWTIMTAPAGDHPRSRGVYAAVERAFAVASGSSPLARGLHGGVVGVHVGFRIIPARAGFTRRLFMPQTLPKDHPRSRGLPWAGPSEGASGGGIIPARAGFTRGRGS